MDKIIELVTIINGEEISCGYFNILSENDEHYVTLCRYRGPVENTVPKMTRDIVDGCNMLRCIDDGNVELFKNKGYCGDNNFFGSGDDHSKNL